MSDGSGGCLFHLPTGQQPKQEENKMEKEAGLVVRQIRDQINGGRYK